MRRLSLSQAGEDTSPNQKNGIRAYCAVFAKTHLNFYRLHLFVFTILPLFASAIFYASNGPSPDNQIPFVDSMFMCYSAMTACGLATILFAQITVWQQVILFLLTAFGSLSSVSIVVILVRRHFFRKRFQHLVAHSRRQGVPADEPHRLKKVVSYLSFDAQVGRNSKFLRLNAEQQEEIGGVEYRALSLLLKIVVGYWLGVQLLGIICIAPWLATSRSYRSVFEPSGAQDIDRTWFSVFLCISAFGNNGMSVVDNSMIDFQQAYGLLLVTGILVLAGNTALPCFLRLTIWTLSKCVPPQSRTKETLQFLLDHPRRCYIYLFPSNQTWFLVFLLVLFNGVDWICFWLLDVGNPVIDALTPAARCVDGLFQALAVRTAGFSVISLGDASPALQFLFAIMMYISAYPIAISVRSTNTYEDSSVAVHEALPDEAELEEQFQRQDRPPGAYILAHMRRQLSFDIGFLTFAIFLLCIFERHRIGSEDWHEVTIFSLIFEVLSAYGCVGLSLGTTRNSASLCGVLRTISKLALIAVMVRGRHRGLPLRIDHSIMLPSELEDVQQEEEGEEDRLEEDGRE
ncbi:hypothetical protein JCM16303_007276 [Sporobolomyces ruberrimus]